MKSARSRCLLAGVCIVAGAVFLPVASLADWVERQKPLAHAVFVPKDYDSGKKYPLVVVIHGNGGQGSDNRIYKNEFYAKHLADAKVQEAQPHFIYVPQCPGGQKWVDSPWERGTYSIDKVPASSSMVKLIEALRGMLKEYSIDKDRIYVIGISMGGQATWDLVCRYPSVFAAAVPVCSCGDSSKAPLLAGVSIWAFHGSDDPTVPVASSREIIANLERAELKVLRLTDVDPPAVPKEKYIYSEYKMGHNVWDKAIALNSLVVSWLFAQSRTAEKPGVEKTGAVKLDAKPRLESPSGGAGHVAKTAKAPGDDGAVFGGATIRVGMTKAEVLDQMARHPDAGWYVPELDSPPTGELHKMDKWLLAYKQTTGMNPGGATVTLTFVNEKVASINAGK